MINTNKSLIESIDTIPHSQEAEQALLGSLIYDNDVWGRIRTIADSSHFYNPVHKKIYDKIIKLVNNGQLADSVILKNAFSQDTSMQDIGGKDYIDYLVSKAASGSSARDYSKEILDLSMRREIIRLSDEAKRQACNPDNEKRSSQIAADIARDANRIILNQVDEKIFYSVQDAVDDLFEGDNGRVIDIGMPCLEDKFPIMTSGVTIIAGRTSQGKTALALEMIQNAGRNPDQRIDFYSLEMTRPQIAARMVSSELMKKAKINIPYKDIYRKDKQSEIPDEDFAILKEVARGLPEINLSVKTRMNASQIISNSHDWGEDITKKPDMLVIDYMDKVSLDDLESDLRNDQKIGEFVSTMRDWGKENDIAVVILFQLNRSVKNDESWGRPFFSALKNSGDTEQHADTILLVYRKSFYIKERYGADVPEDMINEYTDLIGKMEVICAKNRMGEVGSIFMDCDMPTNHIVCPSKVRTL